MKHLNKGIVSDAVKHRLKEKGESAFRKLKKMFLGAINTLDEDSIKAVLVENTSLVDAGYLNLNDPIKDTRSTFLHTAVWFRKVSLIKFLLAHGADPNSQNLKGNSPLHFACENIDKEDSDQIVELLVEAGGDVHLMNHVEKMTPLDKAAMKGKKKDVEETAQIAAKLAAEAENTGADVATRWREEVIRQWETTSKRRSGSPPPTSRSMAEATPRTHKDKRMMKKADAVFEELKRLFNSGLEGNDALIQDLLQQHEDLIELGYLDLNQSSSNTNSTLLHTAVWYMKPHIVVWLLGYGASPNVQNLKGNTPLHMACEKGEHPNGREVITLLLDGGADTTIKNYTQFRSPIEQCPSESVRKIVETWKPKAEREGLIENFPDKEPEAIKMVAQAQEQAAVLATTLIKDKVDQDEMLKQKLARGKTNKATKLIGKICYCVVVLLCIYRVRVREGEGCEGWEVVLCVWTYVCVVR